MISSLISVVLFCFVGNSKHSIFQFQLGPGTVAVQYSGGPCSRARY